MALMRLGLTLIWTQRAGTLRSTPTFLFIVLPSLDVGQA